jgi:hypothetical protein
MRPGRPIYCALLLDSELYSNLNCFWPSPRGLEPDQPWTSFLNWKPLLDFFYSITCTNRGRMHECHVLIMCSQVFRWIKRRFIFFLKRHANLVINTSYMLHYLSKLIYICVCVYVYIYITGKLSIQDLFLGELIQGLISLARG